MDVFGRFMCPLYTLSPFYIPAAFETSLLIGPP